MKNISKTLKVGDLITFQALILQEGHPTKKVIKGSVKNIVGENIYLDNNYFFDNENGKRISQPMIKTNNEIKPLIFVKNNRITDYQSVNEEYTGEPTSKYEAIEFLKLMIQKIILEHLSDGGISTALHGGSNYTGIHPEYNSQDKLTKDKQFPEDSLRIIAKKNLDDIKKQMNLSQQSANDIEKKALEDFCFKYPSLLIYL